MYYAYALIDPRCERPFYIGKGSGKRAWRHLKEAKTGELPRHEVIRAILADGEQPEVRILKKFKSEDAAYEYEKRLIAKIGIENLTNQAPGGKCPWPIKPDPQRAEDLICVRFVRKWALIKERGMVPALRFCGGLYEIPQSTLQGIKEKFADLCQRRSARWLLKHGVQIV